MKNIELKLLTVITGNSFTKQNNNIFNIKREKR